MCRTFKNVLNGETAWCTFKKVTIFKMLQKQVIYPLNKKGSLFLVVLVEKKAKH